ncbi:MAG: hypothetical protein H6881_08265 [Rhodobiaceae bacterium]|nr:hypothetical protein [Rhodobiaceae bacterium]MCC0051857.1 hypothetical protein [Rhodobiaceae bacterium]
MDYNPFDWYWQINGQSGVYSSAANAVVATGTAAYVAWKAAGNQPTKIASMAELVEVLRAAGVPPYHKVKTYDIVKRLEAVNLAATAMTALRQDPVAYARFFTADSRGGVDADAADVRAFLTAVGADPDEILAP